MGLVEFPSMVYVLLLSLEALVLTSLFLGRIGNANSGLAISAEE